MFRFQCEWADGHTASTRSGFDLGHMTIAGEKGICTSRGKKPDQAMMLAIAITDLLYGLERFLKEGQREYTFIGTDSSFAVRFQRTKKGLIAVRCGTTLLGEVEATPMYRAVLSGVESFLGQPGNQLPGDDPVREDLLTAIEEFARLRT
ncbi:MAG: hypothetical protein JXB05_13200 [Myxococcaceae bacterium]|nr:hypothetical protein [Myxococcaceae bacterium]